MATKDFIAAIALGSSQVSGIAGRREADGSLHVLAYARAEAPQAISKGIVRNVERAAQAITSIVSQLESQLGSRIARVYTGISGQSLRTVENVISRELPQEGVIPQKLVDDISDENLQVPVAGMDVLDVAPQEWRIDQHTQADPVGAVGREVTATFLNIVGRSELKRNLELAYSQAGLEVADLIVTPLATALATLQESETRAGCALVDLGAETTTVAVYQAGLLRYLSVIPLGGSHITRDLTTLRLVEPEAEQLKREQGDALYVEPTAEQPATCQTADGRTLQVADVCDIVGARAEEILANVLHQISLSGYEGRLYAGIVLTGGASALRGLEDALRRLGKERAEKVKTVLTPQVKLTGKASLLPADGTATALVGLMMRGHDDCRRPDEPQPEATAQPVAPAGATPAPAVDNTRPDTAPSRQTPSASNGRDAGQGTSSPQPAQPTTRSSKKKPSKEKDPSKTSSKIFQMFGNFTGSLFDDDEFNQ